MKLKTQEEFITRSNLIHKNKFDYSKTKYINNNTKIKIICKQHGLFFQRPSHHLRGQGCCKCNGYEFKRSNTEKFTEKSNKIHNNLYDYSNVNYISNYKKVKIVCKNHGEFLQTPCNHLTGKGCYKCAIEHRANLKRSNTSDFIQFSGIIHNNKYDYSIVEYTTSNKKVDILCNLHGKFSQKAGHHLKGHGCPKCHHRISKPETEFLNYMKIKENNRQSYICRKSVDGYDPATNTVYEFLGDYWHGNPEKFDSDDIHPLIKKTYGELYKITFKKLDKLQKLGYTVKYIWENDWNKFLQGINTSPNIQLL